ncbi:hypothetical protein CsSME_00027827 [Camellia sinensis var. sinensis]
MSSDYGLAPMGIIPETAFEDMINVLCKAGRIEQACKLADGFFVTSSTAAPEAGRQSMSLLVRHELRMKLVTCLLVQELAEKESEDGVFKMLSTDVTRFLTTILIGTTVVNIGATTLVTKAATSIFGEAGVSAATGVMTVAVLLLTKITPKSIAVHNATEVARFVVRPMAWISLTTMLGIMKSLS